MKKITIPIKGMHCKSCEMLIEDKLGEVGRIKKAVLDHKAGTADVYYENEQPEMKEVEKAVSAAGYSVGTEKKTGWINKNINDYKDLGWAFLLFLSLYFVLKSFGLTGLNLNIASDPESLGVVLLVGLTAGFSTCMALVGGLVLGASTRFAETHPDAMSAEKFKPQIFFNLGRVFGFALLGGILGLIGSIFQLSSLALGLITIVVGLVMFIMGLQLTDIFPRLNDIRISLPKSVGRFLGIKNDEYSHKSALLLGALTFFLPCGFTQAMQLFAVSTGSFLSGALVMATFALGTAPGLLGIGGLASIVKGAFARKFFKFAGLLVIFFSFFNIANGYNLTGFTFGPPSSPAVTQGAASDPNVTLENGVQVVRMTEQSDGYSPNRFTIKKGVPVKWIIDAQDPYSCASTIVMSKYKIVKHMTAGENIIDFTPTESGPLKFSCSMGMYTGSFNVVDETGKRPSQSDLRSAAASGEEAGDQANGGRFACPMMKNFN